MPASLDQARSEIRAERSPSWPLKNVALDPKGGDPALSLRRRFSRLVSKRSRPPKNTHTPGQSYIPELNSSSTTNPVTGIALTTANDHEAKPHVIANLCPECEQRATKISTCPLELRRVTSTYQDLRGVAQFHRVMSDTTSSLSTRLSLPYSPAVDDSRMQQLQQSHLDNNQFSSPWHKTSSSPYNSYENLQILSYYEDTRSQQMGDDHRAAMLSEAISADSPSTSSSYPDTQSTSDRHTSRSYSVSSNGSSEARWLANTTTHQQRQRRFNARCSQVIRHPRQENPAHSEQGNSDDGNIMLATVSVGHGRAKLVQIPKPSSSSSSAHARVSSASSKCSTSKARIEFAQPRTPVREVSGFEPYDTPSASTNHSRNSQTIYGSPNFFSARYGGPLRTVDRDLTRQHELRRSKSMTTSTRRVELNPYLSMNVKQLRSARLAYSSTNAIRPSTVIVTSPGLSHTTLSASLSHPLASTTPIISSTMTTVINIAGIFPVSMLSLTSPEVNILRSAPTGEKDRQLMSSLSKVFPKASDKSLSALASWQIIDIYFSDLRSNFIKTVSSHKPGKTSRLPRITRPPSLSASTFTKRLKPHRLPSESSISTVPESILQGRAPANSFERLATSGPQTEMIRYASHIPSKARALLGIDSSTIDTDSRFYHQPDHDLDSRLTLSQITNVQSSVKAVAKKLMELLNTDSGLRCKNAWDEELWMAMGVVVRLVEGTKRTDTFMKQEDLKVTTHEPHIYNHSRVHTIAADGRNLTSFVEDSDDDDEEEEEHFDFDDHTRAKLSKNPRGKHEYMI